MTPTERIEAAYMHACKKHPDFARDLNHAYVIMGEEFGEIAEAMQREDYGDVIDEAAQLAAVCWRLIEMIDLAGAHR